MAELIRSKEFTASLQHAGVRTLFMELQVILAEISEAEIYIHEYASSDMFRDLIAEFYDSKEDSFDNSSLFGNVKSQNSRVIENTRKLTARVSVALSRVDDALIKIGDIYTRVNNYLKKIESDYISPNKRTVNLITWAIMKGAKINQDAENQPGLVIETNDFSAATDLWGILDLLDSLRHSLETLRTLPAYYRTAVDPEPSYGIIMDNLGNTVIDNAGNTLIDKMTYTYSIGAPVRVVYASKHQSIEAIAYQELGDADKAILLLEFNNLNFSDVGGSNWDGREIKIPYDPQNNNILDRNFVLDGQGGARALGKDLPNTLETTSGDFKALDYTDTFFQALENIIRTPVRSIPEDPEWGTKAAGFIGSNMGEISNGLIAIEIARALQQDPRVETISEAKASVNQDKIEISYRVSAANDILESQLTQYLT